MRVWLAQKSCRLAATRTPLAAAFAVALCALVGFAGATSGDGSLSLATSEAPGSATDYVIGPLDKISVHVFEVQDLSITGVSVDASGQIVLPLIGAVMAEGKTANQLSQEIAAKLAEKYLQNPQVSVTIEDSASEKITVEGEVKTPGVYKMSGRTTLLQVIAEAGGPTDTADLSEVAVIRVVNGERKAAMCDYKAIRDSRDPDPELQGQDVVVMKGSTTREVWNEVLKTLPLFGLLAAFG